MEEDVFDATKALRKFYVAYSDSLTESVANSIKDDLDAKWDNNSDMPDITLCDKKKYGNICNAIERTDRTLVIGNSLANKVIPNPCLKDVFCKYGVRIRIQGHKCAIFVEDIDMTTLKELESELDVLEGRDDIVKHCMKNGFGPAGWLFGDKAYSIYRRMYPLKVKSTLQYWYAKKIFLKEIFNKFVLDKN